MESLVVLETVEKNREWCAGMVLTPKANKDVRICVDLKKIE